MGKKGLKKRKKLIALLSAAAAVLSLAGGGIGAAFAMAAAKSSASSKALSASSVSQKGKNPQKAVLAMAGDGQESYLKMNPGNISTPVVQFSEVNGAKISLNYSEPVSSDELYANFKAPAGISVIPFAFNDEFPYGSDGKFDSSRIEQWIMSGNYSSTLAVSVQNAPNDDFYPLLGGVDPSTGKLVNITTSHVPSQGQTVQYAFQEACIANEKFTSGPENGKTMSEVLDGSSKALSPEECDAVFHKQVSISITFGGKTYSLGNQQQVEELMEKLNYQTPSTNASYYNGPSIPGPAVLSVKLSSLAMYFLGMLFKDCISNATVNMKMAMWPNNDAENNSLYSPKGALIHADGEIEGRTPSVNFRSQLFGDPDSYYTASAPASDFNSQGDLSPSSAAGPLGAWFKAVSYDGQPLTRVKIRLYSDSSGSYFAPAYWDPDDVNNNAVGNNYNALDALGTPPASKYRYFGWLLANKATFTLYSIPGHPGYFGISGLPSGTYTVTVEGAGEGSRYSQAGPSFNITLNQGGYSSPEGFSAEGGNADGFVDASSNTVILNAQNPSARLLGSDGKVMPSPSVSETVGSSNPFTYQLSSYLPFASSFSLSLSSPGYSLDPSSIKVAGIPLSTLEGHGASFASYTLSLNSSALSYIESKGFLPATSTSPGETSKILLSGGEENRVFSIAFSSYLNPSFKDGDEVSYSLKYPGQTITGNFPAASTSTTRASKSHAGSSASTLASTNPLWFRAVSEDGKPLTQITVEYQEELDSGDTGAQGTISLSSPAGDPGFFTFPYSFLPYAQGGNGLNVSVEEGGYYSFSSGQQYLSAFFYTAGNSGSDVQFFPFQYMTLQQAVYTAYGTHMFEFDGGLVDPATQTVVVGASNPSSQLLSSDGKVDSSSFPTATVGEANPFTYQVDTFLSYPVNSTVPRLFPGCYGFDSYFNNCPDGSANGFPSGPPEVIQVMNGNGEEVLQDASDIEVAGIPLTELESYGASVSYNDSYGAYDSQASGSAAALSLTLPSKALSFIASNGYLPATSSMPVGSSPLDGSRALSVTFKAYINPAQGKVAPPEWNVGEGNGYGPSEGYAALASRSLRRSFGNFKGSDHKNGGGASLSLPEVYTNGPSDDSLPSSLSASDPSSATGLWFENTFEETFKKDTGCGGIPASYTPSEFTVQNPSGEYLTPVESDGAFEGWEWSGSPYDFKERNSSGTYEWGGLADGTYTVKSVEYPSLSFTGSLSYSSPEALTGKGEVSASWNLPDSGVVLSFDWQVSGGNLDYYEYSGNSSSLHASNFLAPVLGHICLDTPSGSMPVPSRLPFTGGKGVLGLSLGACFLFLLGLGTWWGIRKKRGSHSSSSSSRHGL